MKRLKVKSVKSLPENGEALDKKSLNISERRYRMVFWGVAAVLGLVFVASLSIGRYGIGFFDTIKILLSRLFPIQQTWPDMASAVVFEFRLPRTVAAMLVGSALALSGAAYQSIFKNPMCSPDLLGVSSGACVGAAAAILLGGGSVLIQGSAFMGGILAVAITVMIPRLMRNQSTTVLILSGIVVSSLMSSVMSILKFVADTDTQLAEITYWTMGSFATVTFSDMLPVLPTILVPVAAILLMRYRLNVLSLGENEARSLGINIQAVNGIFILCSTLITASCVCLSGTIGWVGLVIPHTSRMIVGADNKKMLPIALLLGAAFMVLIDLLCRTLTAAELRIGILTGIIGAPFFIMILIKQSRNLR